LRSYDPCYQTLIEHGYPTPLGTTARGFNLGHKVMSGADAPVLWQMGEIEQVLAYVESDVILLADVVKAANKKRGYKRITKAGGYGFLKFKYGRMLTVGELMTLPEKNKPTDDFYIPRKEFDEWLTIK
jgi:hypothetical protein